VATSSRWRAGLLLRGTACAALASVAPGPAAGQLSALRYDRHKVPIGRVFRYLKSDDLRAAGPPLPLTDWPWHSYDFGWASLGATLPHRVDPEADFSFSRTDFVQEQGQPPRFAELGGVRLRYEGREARGPHATRRYRMDGPGLAAPGARPEAAAEWERFKRERLGE
jgi:hypothetical protein